MHNFNLQWRKALLDDLKSEIYAQYFALAKSDRILYIGMAQDADLPKLLVSTLREHNLDHQVLDIYLGRLREYGTKNIADEIISGLHQLLVFARKPFLNHRDSRVTYNGIANLSLTNSGFDLLPLRVRAENRFVFLSAPTPPRSSTSFRSAVAG